MCGDESCKCGGPVITGMSVVSAGQSRSTGSDTWWHRVQNLYSVVVAMNTEPLTCFSEVLEGVVRILKALNMICDFDPSTKYLRPIPHSVTKSKCYKLLA